MKKLLAITCAISMLAVAGVSFAAETQSPAPTKKIYAKLPSITYKASLATARTEVPAEAVFYGFESKNSTDTLKFRDNDAYIEYTAEVDNIQNKLTYLKIHGSNIPGSTTIKYNEADISALIIKAHPDATNVDVKAVKDGNNTYYQAKFETAKAKIEAKMNPFTGVFAERELKFK